MKFPKQSTEVITAKLPGQLKAFIYRDSRLLDDNKPVYAINWFNTRSRLVYDFYNTIAVRSVFKVGGRPFLKCKINSRLLGGPEHQRDTLLIVRYPALKNFGKMLESKYFQLVSLIRSAAVSRFTFGFTKRTDQHGDLESLENYKKEESVYGVLHFTGDVDPLDSLRLGTSTPGIELLFSGDIGATIGTGKGSEHATHVPCIMDGVVVLKARNLEPFKILLDTPSFRDFSQQAEQVFFATYDRVL